MATPYYTKQPVYLEDPSGKFDVDDEFGNRSNILNNPNGTDARYKFQGPRNSYFGKDGTASTTRLNFPFTPTISVIQSANYSSYDIDHSNFQQRAFVSHANMDLNITAPMLVRSEEEAEYVYNASVWLRSTMKMQWANDKNPGQPPPILRFNGHGIYNNVPCVVRDFTWNLDSDIDYVNYKDMRVPVMNMFVLSLTVSYSPKNIREKFSVESYLAGNLKDEGYV